MAFDGLDNPVGWNGNQSGSVVWAENYVEALNPIGTPYDLGFHTGADLNDNVTFGWDSDRLAPVYAIGNGVVTFANRISGSWGNVIVINHGQFKSRYGHVDNFIGANGQAIKAGDVVNRGDRIGQIGNSFGTFAYHLHFDISLTDVLLNKPGHWPGTNLREIVANYADPRSMIRLSRPGNFNWPAPVQAHANANVNFRCGPATNYNIFRTLLAGETVTILHELEGWMFLQLDTGEFGWSYGQYITQGAPAAGGTIPVLPVPTAIGIHASADGGDGVGWEQPIRGEFSTLRPGVIKFQSNHSDQMVGAIVGDNRQTVQKYIVRAFLDWGNRNLQSDDFINFTLNDTVRVVNRIRAHGVADDQIIVELHNEPNLNIEGLTNSWNNGTECVDFFAPVLDRYKALMPNVQYGLGALSPGGAVPNIRYDSIAFLSEMRGHPRWNDFDVHLVHLYTSDDWINSIWWLDHCQAAEPGMNIWITEASWHSGETNDNVSGADYGNKLVELLDLLNHRPTRGITFFCMSAGNNTYRHETWCRSQDPLRPWTNISSRGVAAEIRRQRP